MEKEEFLAVSREFFKSIGFQTLKKSKFYYESPDVILRAWMMLSNFSECYYIEYDFRLKKLHSETPVSDDNVWDTIVAGRLKHFNYLLCEKNSYLKELEILVKKHMYPIMQDGIVYIKKLAKDRNTLGTGIHFTPEVRSRIINL